MLTRWYSYFRHFRSPYRIYRVKGIDKFVAVFWDRSDKHWQCIRNSFPEPEIAIFTCDSDRFKEEMEGHIEFISSSYITQSSSLDDDPRKLDRITVSTVEEAQELVRNHKEFVKFLKKSRKPIGDLKPVSDFRKIKQLYY
jgi:hypothetical protein